MHYTIEGDKTMAGQEVAETEMIMIRAKNGRSEKKNWHV